MTEVIREGAGKVYRCERCDFEMLDGETINYDGEYRRTHGPKLGQVNTPEDIFNAYVQHQEMRRNLLLPYLHPRVRLLEVGCSAGHFLYNIKGDVKEAVGVDTDTDALEYAQQKTGCRVFTELEHAPQECDIVCCYQTLEHVDEPFGFVDELKEHLTERGVLVVEVPSLNDPLLTLYNCVPYRKFFYHEAHKWYFSPNSLLAFMDMCDMEGHLEYSQDYNFMNTLHWIHTGKPQPTCEAGLAPARLPTTSSTMVAGDLRHWAERVDIEYRNIIQRYGYAENVTFIGRCK